METKEQGKWIDKDTCVMNVEETTVLFDKQSNKEVGTNKNIANIKATYDMVVGGINVKKERISQNLEGIAKAKEDIKSLGKVPAKSAELVRLERNLRDLQNIQQKSQLETKILQLENEIAKDEEFVKNREAILSDRPED